MNNKAIISIAPVDKIMSSGSSSDKLDQDGGSRPSLKRSSNVNSGNEIEIEENLNHDNSRSDELRRKSNGIEKGKNGNSYDKSNKINKNKHQRRNSDDPIQPKRPSKWEDKDTIEAYLLSKEYKDEQDKKPLPSKNRKTSSEHENDRLKAKSNHSQKKENRKLGRNTFVRYGNIEEQERWREHRAQQRNNLTTHNYTEEEEEEVDEYYRDFQFLDNEEEAPVEDEIDSTILNNDTFGFNYEEKTRWWFMDWRVKKQGWMYKDLLTFLLLVKGRPNSVTLTSYLLTVNSDPRVIKYKAAMLIMNGSAANFDQQLCNFFFSDLDFHTTQLESLGHANSLYTDLVRQTSKKMNVLHPLSGSDWWENVKMYLKFFLALYGLYKIYKLMNKYSSIKTIIMLPAKILGKLSVNLISEKEKPKTLFQKITDKYVDISEYTNKQQMRILNITKHLFPEAKMSTTAPPTIWGAIKDFGAELRYQFWEEECFAGYTLAQCSGFYFQGLMMGAAFKILWNCFHAPPVLAAPVPIQVHINRPRATNHNRHAIFPSHPIFSAYFEEIVKTVPGMWRVVTCIERIIYGDWRTYKWHQKSMAWKFSDRLKAHIKINSPEHKEIVQCYDNFVTTGKFCIPEGKDTDVRTLKNMPLPIPKNPGGKNYATMSDQSGRKPLKNQGEWYPLLWHVSKSVVPSKSYENMAACLDERVLSVPNSVVLKDTASWTLFKLAYNAIKVDSVELPGWEMSLDARQKENIRKAQIEDEKQVRRKYIKCQIKSDEMVMAKTKMVPRFLTNQAGMEFLRMGRATAEINHWLATYYWDIHMSHPIPWKGSVYTICFAHGTLSTDLDIYYNKALATKGYHQLVLGDDTGLIVNQAKITIIENDFSGYDRSENKDLLEEDNQLLIRCGFRALVNDKREMYKKSLVMFAPEFANCKLPIIRDISGAPVEMRFTGESDTCGGNSRINGTSTMAGVCCCETKDGIDLAALQQHYKNLGLTAKLKEVAANRLTFLKGVFLLNVNEKYSWVRLPSFLIKFGKILNNPQILDKRNLPYHQKVQSFLLGQWLGYGKMKTNWFYTAIDEQIRRICSVQEARVFKLEDWQVQQGECYIPDDNWNMFMLDRYNISVEEQQSLIQSFQTVDGDELPVIIRNNIIDKLDIDY